MYIRIVTALLEYHHHKLDSTIFAFFSVQFMTVSRGGRYLGYIVKPRYSDVTIPVSSKFFGNDIVAIS